MKLKDYLNDLNKYIEKYPEVLTCEVNVCFNAPDGKVFTEIESSEIRHGYYEEDNNDGYNEFGKLKKSTIKKPANTIILGENNPIYL